MDLGEKRSCSKLRKKWINVIEEDLLESRKDQIRYFILSTSELCKHENNCTRFSIDE